MLRDRRLIATLVLVAAASAAVIAQQDRPVFRSGVEAVTVDVAVVDKSGKPITNLKPEDFTVIAANRPRRVVTAEFIVSRGRPATAARADSDGPALPAPSSNAKPPGGRSFLFVIDVEHIGNGNGKSAMASIGAFLNRLSPDDRVGIVAVPYSSLRVDLTTNRQIVARAAATIWGASTRDQGEEMTVGEAQRIELLQEDARIEYCVRLTPTADPLNPPGCPPLLDLLPRATRVMNEERRRSRALFDTLRALATAMAPLEGPKALVLVSDGTVNDRGTQPQLREFAVASERARTTLYALNLQGAIVDVTSKYNMTTAHGWDHETLLDGMGALAIAGRGDVFLVSGTPESALDRIDAEMTGYYLLSFERDLQDRDGQRSAIDVKVKTPGAFVRARTEFTLEKPAEVKKKPSPPPDMKGEIGNILRWPVPLAGLPINIDAYAMPSPASQPARVILAATIVSTKSLAGVGYEVTDESGKGVADDFTLGPVKTVEHLSGNRQLYTAALALTPGRYRVKLATIDQDDRRGTIEHEFQVRVARAGAVQLGDVFVGEAVDGNFLPAPVLAPGAPTLPVRVDLLGDTAAAFADAKVTLEFARPDSQPFATMSISLRNSDDPLRRVALGTLALTALPAGEYLVTVRLTANGEMAASSRRFTKR